MEVEDDVERRLTELEASLAKNLEELMQGIATNMHLDFTSDVTSHPPDLPVLDHPYLVKHASEFRQHMETNMPNCRCAVCARLHKQADVQVRCLMAKDGGANCIPNLHLLRADVPSTEDLPRPAHTRATIKGVDYCLQVDEKSMAPTDNARRKGHMVYVCNNCLDALDGGAKREPKVPTFSLVRCDPGFLPATTDLPPLTYMESVLVGVLRPSRHIIYLKPRGGLDANEMYSQKAMRGHVVAFPNPSPEALARSFPVRMADVPEVLQVVLLSSVTSDEDLLQRMNSSKVLQVSVRHHWLTLL
jgi:hypothetical protein